MSDMPTIDPATMPEEAGRPEAGVATVPVTPKRKRKSRAKSKVDTSTSRDAAPDAVPDWDLPAAPPQEYELKPYWCGALEGGPRSVYHLGGVEFPQWTDRVTQLGEGQGGRTQRSRQKGCIQYLSPRKIEQIKRAAALTVARRKGQGDRARFKCFSIDPKTFRTDPDTGDLQRTDWREPGDIPLGCFVFMIPYEGLGADFRAGDPTPLMPPPPDANRSRDPNYKQV